MYRNRMDTITIQLDEVEKERNQVETHKTQSFASAHYDRSHFAHLVVTYLHLIITTGVSCQRRGPAPVLPESGRQGQVSQADQGAGGEER